jgi:hypothetical protein
MLFVQPEISLFQRDQWPVGHHLEKECQRDVFGTVDGDQKSMIPKMKIDRIRL